MKRVSQHGHRVRRRQQPYRSILATEVLDLACPERRERVGQHEGKLEERQDRDARIPHAGRKICHPGTTEASCAPLGGCARARYGRDLVGVSAIDKCDADMEVVFVTSINGGGETLWEFMPPLH